MLRISESWKAAREGLFRQTPPLFTALGLCPALAVTTALVNGVVMGLATAAVLLGTALLVLAIRRLVPKEIRIPVYTVIVATMVTVIDLVLSGFLPEVHAVLGLFVPLIMVNCIVLGRIEASFTRDRPLTAVGDALGYGLGFTWALALIGGIRELGATGAIAGYTLLPAGYVPWQIMRTPPGAFFTMGILVALIQLVRLQLAKKRAVGEPGQAARAA